MPQGKKPAILGIEEVTSAELHASAGDFLLVLKLDGDFARTFRVTDKNMRSLMHQFGTLVGSRGGASGVLETPDSVKRLR